MKLRKIISIVLALVVIATAVPVENLIVAQAAGETTTGKVNAGDTTYVRLNRYSDNGDSAGSISAGDLRWDRGSLYEYKTGLTTVLTWDNTQYRWPYAALKVTAPEAGTYDIAVEIKTGGNPTYSTIGMVVNGVMNVLSFTRNKTYTINTEAMLRKGENIIVFTSPMPASASNRASGTNDGNVYPWNDFCSFSFADGITVQEAPTGEEVVASINSITRVEAENTAYTIWNGYNKTEAATGASGTDSTKNVVGGASKSKCTQTSVQLASFLDDNKTAYVQYQVEAPKDGTYDIRLGGYVGSDGNLTDKTTVMVNDTVYEAVYDGFSKLGAATLNVNLKKGYNIIRCFAPIANEESAGWFNQDFLELDSRLTAVEQSQTTVNAGDENKVLKNQYTDKGDTLGSASTGSIRGDKPSIETVGFANEKIERWPWAAMKVTAPKAGYYDIAVNLGTNKDASSTQIAMLIDGKVVAQPYTKAGSAIVDCSVYLSAGTHLLVFTLPMPMTQAEAASASNTGAAYPWCDYNSFVLDSKLTLESVPTLEDVKNSCGITVNAGDEEKVLPNKFNDNGDTLGGANTDDFKYDRVSVETILSKDLSRATYAALKVTVTEDGVYDIYTTISTKASTTSKQIALMIDKNTVEMIEIEGKSGNQFVGTEVSLTAGTHILVFTSAIPLTDEEAQAIPEGSSDGWVGMNNAYPWFDFISFSFENGITAENILEAETDGIEAEDTTYVSHAGGYEVQSYLGASEGKVASGEDVINASTDVKEDATTFDWGTLSYVEFSLEATSAGTQDITVKVIPEAVNRDESSKLPKVVIYANGELHEAALTTGWNTAEEITIPVELVKGSNVIRCFGTSKSVVAGTKLSFDYFEFDKSVVTMNTSADASAKSTVVNAGDETKVLANNFKDEGDTLGSADVNDLRWDALTLDTIMVDDLQYIPYAALKVNAVADGYYDIKVAIGANKNAMADQLGLFVDGASVYALGFEMKNNTEVNATIYLRKGEHTLVFTTPMPETEKEFDAYAKENGLTNGNGMTHPWMNFMTITLSEGLTVKDVPTVAEVEYPSYDRIEAEDTKYVLYRGYKAAGEKNKKASNGTVIGGATKKWFQQTFAELKEWIDASTGHVAYVEYAVIAPADGTYTVRPGIIADIDKNVKNRSEMEKPFIAVIVNDTAYKAQYTADLGESQAIKLDVKLKKGLNIIRCTSLTIEQEAYSVSAWVNQDYLDLDKRLVAVERSTAIVEAEKSEYYQLMKVQDGSETEKASSGKVLGGVDVIRAKAVGLTTDTFTAKQIRMAPYHSYTVEAPMDGYYSMTLNASCDGRIPKSQIAMLVDGKVSTVKYNRGGKSTADCTMLITTYLTKGEHVLTFTSPLPADAKELANTEWSQRWMNFDYLTLHDGLKLAAKQKAPTDIPDLVRIESENVGLPNLTKVVEAAEGKDAKEGYIGGAKYRRSQDVADIKANGIDAKRTPFVQYTVQAKKSGTYTVYFQASYGTYRTTVEKMNGAFAIEVNGKVSFHEVELVKDKTIKCLIPVEMKLSAGNNIVRLSHLTADTIQGEGYGWADFNYIEMQESDSKQLTFLSTNGVVEAEDGQSVDYRPGAASGSSGGQKLGNANYKYVDENDITFENLNIEKMDDLARVTYTVQAEEAGNYYIAVQFYGGAQGYTYQELVERDTIGFALSVNEGEKQLVEFCPDASGSTMSRIVEVELQEGENKIMVTATLADYLKGVSPRIEDEYRLYWIDHDALRLTKGVSNSTEEVVPYDVNNSDINHAQLSADVTRDADSDKIEITTPMIIGGISFALLLAIFFIILFLKKKKKEEEGAK